MPVYNAALFDPPAPLALVTVRSPASRESVTNVSMLIDSGADVSLLPRTPIAHLIETEASGDKFELERSTDHATSGRHSLKITFVGGRWPTLTTTHVPADWMPYWTFHADVTSVHICHEHWRVRQWHSRAIITERGVIEPVSRESIAAVIESANASPAAGLCGRG